MVDMPSRTHTHAAISAIALAAGWVLCMGAQADTLTHTVVEGETLWSISEQHTGDPTLWPRLQQTNRLNDPMRLRIGQVLRVPGSLGALPPVEASVAFAMGEVWATSADGAAPVQLRTGAKVSEGTVIEVRDKAFVRLKLADGSAFGLAAGSKAQVERLRYDGNNLQSQTVVRMLSGRVESEVVPRRHPRSRFDVHTPMAVASVRGTQFGVSASADGDTSEVTHGKVVFRTTQAGRAQTTLTPGQGARVDSHGRLQRAGLLPAADLSGLPERWDDGEFVHFDVAAQKQAQAYRLRLLQTDAPGGLLRESWQATPAITWQGLDDGNYTLAIQSLGPLGLLGRTAEHRFQVHATPAAPLYRQPASGATVTGASVDLRCTELADVDGYRIQVARDAAFQTLVVDAQPDTQCAHTATLPPGHYHWRIASRSASVPGGQGPFSLPAHFEVAVTANPTPTASAGPLAFWTARDGMSYRVQVATDPAFNRVLSDTWLPDTQVPPPTPAAETLYLRWQSRDAQGRTSRMSAVHRLTMASSGGNLITTDNQPVTASDTPIGIGSGSAPTPR